MALPPISLSLFLSLLRNVLFVADPPALFPLKIPTLCWYFVNLMARSLHWDKRFESLPLGTTFLISCVVLRALVFCFWSCLLAVCHLAGCSPLAAESDEDLSSWNSHPAHPNTHSNQTSNRIKDKRFMCVRVRVCFNEHDLFTTGVK